LEGGESAAFWRGEGEADWMEIMGWGWRLRWAWKGTRGEGSHAGNWKGLLGYGG